MIIRVLLTVTLFHIILAQDEKLINVKQIMRDTFDILKNLPPPTNFNQVSKVMFPTTTVPPVYYNNNPGYPPQLTPDEYQALLTAQSNRPLTIQQRSILFNLQQKINTQKQYTQNQRGGQYNPNAYYPRTQQQPQQQQQQPPIMNPINRIFATPTEKDMERLLRLPADILYKIAEEGHYIDPEDDSQGYSHAKTMSELDRPLPAGVSSSDSNTGLFGNGFSFNVGENNAGQITNPFLTKEDVKKEGQTPEPKPQQNTTVPKVEEKQEPQTQTPAKEITYQNAGEKVDKSKPYFVVNNGEWQLVVPQPDNKPALQIPVKDFTKLTEAVARASARSGMPVDMAKMVAAEELHVKSAAETTTPKPNVEVSTTETPKKIEKTPDSAFVQEAESVKSEEEEKAPTIKTTTAAEEEVITLNGKVYKLVKEEKPKKKKTKKTKKAQTTGQNSPLPEAPTTEAPSTTTHLPMPSTTAAQAAGVPFVTPLNPVQLPGSNQPYNPLLLGQYQQQQPLTFEQQQILAELQQRYLQSQALLNRQQTNGQSAYVQNYNSPQLPPTAISTAAQQMTQPYYQKVSAPATLPQIPSSVVDQIPVKIEHYPTQAVVSKAAAAPIKIIKETPHHIDPKQSTSPKQKVYSLQELDQFYNMQNSDATTEVPSIKETTTQKIYAPHKQIKIRMNSNIDESADENESPQKATVVDATADAIDEEKKRIAELRRRFAVERQQLSRRHRAKFEKTTNFEPTTPPTFTVTEQHCYNIKNFAKQAGSSNVYDYAITHCHYIENYYPDLKCANVDDYIKVCQQYYSTRRMLFA